SMADCEGIVYHYGQLPNFVVRSFFLFAIVFIADYLRTPAGTAAVPAAAAAPVLPAAAEPAADHGPRATAVRPEPASLLDESRWQHRFTIDEVANNLVALCRETASFHTLLYFVYDQKNKELVAEVRCSQSPHLANPLRLTLGMGLIGRLAQQKERRYVSNFAQDWRVLHYYTAPEKIRSVLVVPVVQNNELSGVLAIDSKSAGHFSATQLEFIGLIAQAFDQLWHLAAGECSYQEHIRKYRLLLEIQQSLNATAHDLGATEKVIAEFCRELLQADACTMHYPDRAEEFVLHSDRARYLLNATHWVAKHRQTLRVASVPNETGLLPGVHRDRLLQGFQALLAAPIIENDRVIAVIIAEGRLTGQFRPVDEEALRILTAQVAVVLATARRNDEAARALTQANDLLAAYGDLTRAFDWRGAQQGICDAFMRLFPASYALFYRVAGQKPQLLCGRDWEGEMPRQLLRCRALQQAISTRQVLEIEDAYTSTLKVESRGEVRALLIVPLMENNQVTGLVELGSRKVAGFSSVDNTLIDRLRVVAAQAWASAEERRALHTEAQTDPASACGNARWLESFARRAAGEFERGTMAALTAMAVEIMTLPEHSRRYGSAEGDKLAARIGEILRGCAGGNARVVRRRDDLFMLLLPDCDAVQAAATAEEVVARLRHEIPYCRGEKLAPLSPVVGVATGSVPVMPDKIMASSETALQRARGSAEKLCFFVA
ncbi:MAG TPA: GAF domain-containing protein, partial [bacterium]|nr:GAF domain-containing protein [bacterium]